MPLYYKLRHKIRSKSERLRAVTALEKLRTQLDRDVPAKDADGTLLLATWNIRDFDKKNRRGFGDRMPETWFYIAEVISRFDFVAVQEVNRLDELEEVMDILGRDWSYIASDETDRSLGGNGERLTYIYDTRKVQFQNIAGEIVLPRNMLITEALDDPEADPLSEGKQFRRTPYVTRFQAGWFKFAICTVHIYFGDERGDKLKQRVQEIAAIAAYLSERADEALSKERRAMFLLGDFNIVKPDHETMTALTDNGFTVPKELQKKTNFKADKFYDQIAFNQQEGVIRFVENKGNAGVFDLFETIMTDGAADTASYLENALKSSNGKKAKTKAEKEKYYAAWKTYQLSDHNPLWCRIEVNSSAEYLTNLKARFAEELED